MCQTTTLPRSRHGRQQGAVTEVMGICASYPHPRSNLWPTVATMRGYTRNSQEAKMSFIVNKVYAVRFYVGSVLSLCAGAAFSADAQQGWIWGCRHGFHASKSFHKGVIP